MEHKEEITEICGQMKYESKLATLLFLRCILPKPEHIWIAGNANDVGKFGNIIFYQDGFAYIVHTKFKENSEPVSERDFTTSAGNFYLENYFQDVANLKRLHSKFKCDTIDSLSSCKIYHILFTNRSVNYCKFLKHDCDNEAADFLNTKTNVDFYRIDLKDLPGVVNLTSNLYLFANQKIDDLSELIVEEMRKILKHFELSHLNVNDVAEGFAKYVIDWTEEKLEGYYSFKKQDILCKLVAFLFHQYKVNVSFKKCSLHHDKQKQIWSEIVSNKTVTLVDCDERVEEFLLGYIGSEVKKYCELSVDRQDDYLSVQLQDLHLQEIETCTENTLLDVYEYLWMNGKLPLLLEINNARHYQDILHILALSQYNYKIIILNKTKEPLHASKDEVAITYFSTLQDLDEIDRSKILKQFVKLQGRSLVILENVIDENMLEYIKCSDIIRILSNSFSIGNELEPLPVYFIERSISKVFVKAQVLDRVKDEIFLIEESVEKPFEMLSVQNFNIRRLEEFAEFDFINPNCRIIIAQENITREQWKKFESSKKTIHCLKIYDANLLEWQISIGWLCKIEKYLLELQDKWDSNINKLYHNSTVILSGSAGMGKSLFLDYVAQQAPADKWVLKINLHEYQEYFQNDHCKNRHTKGSQHLEYFKNSLVNQINCNTKLSNAVFQKFVKAKDVIFLLDGFDEIAAFYKDEVTNIIDSLQKVCQLWLTTRPQMKTYLEEEFDAFFVTLKPFSLSDQKELFVKCFSGDNANLSLEFVDKLLEAAKKNLGDKNELMGTPLLIRLLAEVFNNCDVNFKDDFDLIYLYQVFVDKKIEATCDKFAIARVTFKDYWTLLALKTLFPVNKVEKWLEDKIQTSQNQFNALPVVGMHRTFLEYLAGQWLCVNIKNQDEEVEEIVQILLKQRFNQNYNFLFTIFEAQGAEVNKQTLDYNTPLHNAVLERNPQAIAALLSKGIINKQNFDGNTPLHLAILDPKIRNETITQLISKDDKINIQNDEGNTPLHLALLKYKPKIAKFLIRKGAQVNIKNKKCQTALHRAAYNGYDEIILQILPDIADMNKRDDYGRTPLFYAEMKNKIDTLKLLISNGADVNLQDATGESVLHRAAFNGHNQIIVELLSVGVDIEQRDNHGCTPLFYATFGNQVESLKLLLTNGADVNVESYVNEIPLHNAAYGGYINIVSELLSKGIHIYKQDDDGNSALFFAVFSGAINSLKLLLSNDAKVNLENGNGEIALHRAASDGNNEIVTELLLKGVNVNKQNHFGYAPLHLALMENHFDTMKLLISNGADVNIDSKDGAIDKLLQDYLA